MYKILAPSIITPIVNSYGLMKALDTFMCPWLVKIVLQQNGTVTKPKKTRKQLYANSSLIPYPNMLTSGFRQNSGKLLSRQIISLVSSQYTHTWCESFPSHLCPRYHRSHQRQTDWPGEAGRWWRSPWPMVCLPDSYSTFRLSGQVATLSVSQRKSLVSQQ